VAPPFRQAEFDIYFGSGIAHEAGLVDLGAQAGLVEKSGTWYVYKGDKMGQGRENAVDFLKTNPKIALELDKAIREQYLGDKKEADKKELDKKVLDATKTSSKSGVLAGKK
jgi:recombination protein RecA